MHLDPIVFTWLIIPIDFMNQLLISFLEVTDQGADYIGPLGPPIKLFQSFVRSAKQLTKKRLSTQRLRVVNKELRI